MPGLPLERQIEILRAAGVDLGDNLERCFIDRLSKSAIRKRDPAALKEREHMLRPSTRSTTELIHVAGFRVLGLDTADRCRALLAAMERKARVRCHDIDEEFSADMPGPILLKALVAADEAHRRGRREALQSAGVTAAANAKKRRLAPRIAKAKELWPTDMPTWEIAKHEDVRISERTLRNHLGPRSGAREMARKGKKHA